MNLPNLGGLPNLSPPFTPESMTGMATVSLPLPARVILWYYYHLQIISDFST